MFWSWHIQSLEPLASTWVLCVHFVHRMIKAFFPVGLTVEICARFSKCLRMQLTWSRNMWKQASKMKWTKYILEKSWIFFCWRRVTCNVTEDGLVQAYTRNNLIDRHWRRFWWSNPEIINLRILHGITFQYRVVLVLCSW